MKLFESGYSLEELSNNFGVTLNDIKKIRKEKNISNQNLETSIRNIITILYYIDNKYPYISDRFRNKIIEDVILIYSNIYPNKKFYKQKLYEVGFETLDIDLEIEKYNIDVNYRIDNMKEILSNIDNLIEKELELIKEKVINYNNKKLYNELITQKENGKIFKKEDLTYDILYELAIIENKIDSLIGDIFGLTKSQVRNIRIKNGLGNKYLKKIMDYPEIVHYLLIDRGLVLPKISRKEVKKILFTVYKQQGYKEKNDYSDNLDTIQISELEFDVVYSNNKYVVKPPKSKKIKNGSHINQQLTNNKKISSGKLGEKIVYDFEVNKLKKLGLEDLAKKVCWVTKTIDRDVTYDGLGYDIISFNELGEKIYIEVKTSQSDKDKGFYISKKEIDLMKGNIKDIDKNHAFIYYVSKIDLKLLLAEIKCINSDEFLNYKLEATTYKVIDAN